MECKIDKVPLLSIVIATRNRIPYAISAIDSILEIADPRLELVVQDNSDSRDLESYVHANIQDNRMRYRYTPPPFSSIDNFNAAVELATGEYVCLIGDDDGVNPEIIEAAEWAKNNDLDVLTSRIMVFYPWQNTGLTSKIRKVEEGSLRIREFSGKSFEVNVNKEVSRLLRNGIVNYLRFDLPKLYHGLVRRRCLDEIRVKIGSYFKGLCPDIFAVLSISEVANRVVFLDYPLTISGVCPAACDRKVKYSRRLEGAFLFRDRGEYHWCELVPRVYSSETIWADSGIAALRAMGRDDLVAMINFPKLAAFCIVSNIGFVEIVIRDYFEGMRTMGKNPIVGAVQLAWSFLTGPGMWYIQRAWNGFQIITKMKVSHNISSLENMVEVSHALTEYLQLNKHSISKYLGLGKYQG